MDLSKKTLEKLRVLINEETEYRSGPRLVEFFNELGFNDSYDQGFPSRWTYTDDRLNRINRTPKLDACIRNVLAPVNFVGEIEKLDQHISELNKYLAFDKWKVLRDNEKIAFKCLDKVEIDEGTRGSKENDFLSREFTGVNVRQLGLEGPVSDVIDHRIAEIEKCFSAESPLAVILLAGSTLEGIALGLANKYPKTFNTSDAAPKDQSGKVKPFPAWSLGAFIDVLHDLRVIENDTKKFSHTLREFRNYVHPFEQMASQFRPREHTAKISLQVLKAAIHEINENQTRLFA